MSCLAEERFVEILDRGGLDATRPDERTHLDQCDACRESWASVAAAGELLSSARPKAVAKGRLFPVLVAAAMLLTIVGVIAVRSIPSPVVSPKDPVVLLLEGNPEEVRTAREAFLKQGRKAIPLLVAARPKFKGSARLQTLQDLIFDLKRASIQDDPDKVAVFLKLASMKVNLEFSATPMKDVVAFIRDFTSLNMILDPGIDTAMLQTLTVKDITLKDALDLIGTVMELDYDFRYGVLFFTTPMRLWSTEKGVGLPTANGWTRQVLAGRDAEARDKLPLIRVTLDMQGAPLSAIGSSLSEICGIPVAVPPALGDAPVDLKVTDVRLSHVLELLTLPQGRDVRIQDGAVKIETGQ